MAKALRWLAYGVGGLVALLLVAALAIWILSARALGARVAPEPSRLAAPTPAQLADGPRQLKVLGCLSCHGDGMRGKLFFEKPGIGKIYAPNVTLVAAKASDAQLEHALRQGIGHDGRSLFIMPSTTYQSLTDAETAAIIAAIRALPKGGKATPANDFGPLARIGIVNGKFPTQPALVKQYRTTSLPQFGPQHARGRHLVATQCADCHGPLLEGREVEPGMVSPDLAIAGAYDAAQFRTLLRTGVPPSGRNLGLMTEIARTDTRHYRDDEIDAIHAYLVERAKRAN
ncbi:c-type cytochrome [Sphingomonas sabuli]|uniref:C-type cytochrome n=1 Tax=Sphingomonas sabuli TaxID=2764186 RepID=A0A7G9L540_9SPHN|nr:c-type cytochrome [Sphingomonas sabuli]QNM83739.1 c-type cytochrome [Sphingomonas sabuli]